MGDAPLFRVLCWITCQSMVYCDCMGNVIAFLTLHLMKPVGRRCWEKLGKANSDRHWSCFLLTGELANEEYVTLFIMAEMGWAQEYLNIRHERLSDPGGHKWVCLGLHREAMLSVGLSSLLPWIAKQRRSDRSEN